MSHAGLRHLQRHLAHVLVWPVPLPTPSSACGSQLWKPVAVLQRSAPVSWRWNPAHPPSHGPRDLGHAGASRVNAGFQKQGPLTVALRVTERRRKEYIIYFSTGKSASPTGAKLPVSIDSLYFFCFPSRWRCTPSLPKAALHIPASNPLCNTPEISVGSGFPGFLGPLASPANPLAGTLWWRSWFYWAGSQLSWL